MESTQLKSTPPSRISTARRGDRDYVKNSALYDSLVKWYDSGSENIPNTIVSAITQICERLSRKGNFVNYTYREDMVASATLVCIVAVQRKKFNVDQPTKNPFAYFTQIAYNEMIRLIKVEKVHSYIKHKALDHHITDSMLAGEPVDIPLFDHGDRNYDLIRHFEPEKKVEEAEDTEVVVQAEVEE